ncbi:MAG: rRNA maturation RNase YbeY [Casimicrobiaceae bacterium]
MIAVTTRRRLTLTVQHAADDADLPARGLLRRCVAAALERDADITLRFVERDEARLLNRRYRRQDRPTNVLSFVYDDERDVLHGDIVLCAPVLRREAEQQGKALAAHCAHLVVHGTLHLQGYDHLDTADAQRMEAREAAILAGLGYADPYATGRPRRRGAR